LDFYSWPSLIKIWWIEVEGDNKFIAPEELGQRLSVLVVGREVLLCEEVVLLILSLELADEEATEVCYEARSVSSGLELIGDCVGGGDGEFRSAKVPCQGFNTWSLRLCCCLRELSSHSASVDPLEGGLVVVHTIVLEAVGASISVVGFCAELCALHKSAETSEASE
jgi:hypothetical protein